MQNQMQKDLDRHASELLKKWIEDVTDTYKRAGCTYEDSTAHLAFLFVQSFAAIIVARGGEDEFAHECLQYSLNKVRSTQWASAKE